MDVSIHRLKPKDLKTVLEIENLSFDDPWTKGMFCEEIKNGNFYVVKKDKDVIGYGGFSIVEDDVSLVNLAIAPNYRRKGIGGYLLEYLIKMAKDKNGKRMLLEVKSKNITAQQFYHKNGFIEIGIRKDYYKKGEDAVIMERKL